MGTRVVGLRVFLVGAGHAHLHIIRRAQALRDAGIDLCLISPPTFRYSGLATGSLSGDLDLDAGEIAVGALAAAYGVEYRQSVVTEVDRANQRATLTDGAVLAFEVISFNIGSTVADPHGLHRQPDVWPVKPLAQIFELRQLLEAAIGRSGQCPAVVVAGSGQTGFEVAAALAGLCERRGVSPRITLIGPTPDASWAPPAAAQKLLSALRNRGVRLKGGQVVARAVGDCQLASGETIACDRLVLAGGLVAPGLTRRLGLPTDKAGRLRTTSELRSVGDPHVFAVGDCAVVADDPRPCVGVFGVRAAPVLVRNLMAMATGAPLTAYRPQRRWLSIMDLGDGTGLALRGRWWWFGRGALRLKRWLDLRFIARARGKPG